VIDENGREEAKRWKNGEKVVYMQRGLVEHRAMLCFLSDFGKHYSALIKFCQTTSSVWIHLAYDEILTLHQTLFNSALAFVKPEGAADAGQDEIAGEAAQQAPLEVTCELYARIQTNYSHHRLPCTHRCDLAEQGAPLLVWCGRTCAIVSVHKTRRGLWWSATCGVPATTKRAQQAGIISTVWGLRPMTWKARTGGARSAWG
jgi:hypothetical protein